MLPRVPIRQTLPCFRPCRRPSSSDAASLYSSKVRALPFAISAAEAVSYLGAAASLLNLTSFPMIFSSLAAHYVPNAGFTSYQPSRIQPLYLPGWFIDAEVTAKLWVGESGPHEEVSVFQHSYVPGFSFKPLSEISFSDDAITPSKAVPFSKELLNQHGSDITCLPYTFSPLSLLNTVHSLSHQEATFSAVRFDPTSVQTNMLAAYPVLLPVYLAQYRNEQLKQPSTFVLEAFSTNGHGMFHKSLLESFPSYLEGMFDAGSLKELVSWHGEEKPFVRMKSLRPSTTARSRLETGLESMVARKLHSNSSNNSVDMADLRVREFTDAEVEPIRLWTSVGVDLATSKRILENLSSGRSKATGIVIGASGIKNVGRNHMVTTIKERTVSLEKTREDLKPEWLKQWQISRK